jgi:hypothetical protein
MTEDDQPVHQPVEPGPGSDAVTGGRSVTLLGPQRRPRLSAVVAQLGLEGPFATINAGWQERESDDDELDRQLQGRSGNLTLWARWQDVLERDPEYAVAARQHRDVLQETQDLYLLGLDHAMQAVLDLERQPIRSERVREAAVSEAEWVLRKIDERHLAKVQAINADFYDSHPPHERPSIVEHRTAVAGMLAEAGALVLTGGHVGVLLEVLHLFNVGAQIGDLPVVAWSAGAMALTERVVLFHDRAAHGPTSAEVYDAGIGLVTGIVPLPHARRRLHTEDAARMGLLARRFAPSTCLLLDDGARVQLSPGGELPGDATVFDRQGSIVAKAEAAA